MAANANNLNGIVNIPPPPPVASTRIREPLAPVPNTPEAAEEMAAKEAAIAARAFDTSKLPIYVPTGHGELLVRDGEFVKHRVPDGCMYITFGYAGVLTWNRKFEQFLESFKNPEIMECFQNPTIPANQIKLKKYFEPYMFDENAKFMKKEEGILAIKYPNDEYIEARYFLTADFAHSEQLTDSGFYNAKTIAKKNIQKIKELPPDSEKDLTHILECYNGSIIPGVRFINDTVGKRFRDKKLGAPVFPAMLVHDTTMGWPFAEKYEDFLTFDEWQVEFDKKIKDDLAFKAKRGDMTIVDYFIRLLRAIREELRSLPANIYELKPKVQGKLIKPINEFVIQGLNILKKAKVEMDRAGVSHYPFVFSTLALFEHLKNTKYDSDKIARLVVGIDRHIRAIQIKRQTSEEQFPGEGLLQSFLFKNFPGIHINFLCRVPSLKKGIPAVKILEAQRLSDENRAAKQDVLLARELVEPSVLIATEKEAARKAAAKERRQEMARLVELNRQIKIVSDPYALRNLGVYPVKRNVSEAELEEMREFARTHEKQLSDAPITPRSSGKLSIPSSWGSWGTRSNRSSSRSASNRKTTRRAKPARNSGGTRKTKT